MRIAVGSIMHESNTFTHITTSLEDFEPIIREAIFDSDEWLNHTSAGGILRTLSDHGVEILPTLFGDALPSGVIEADAYRRMRDEMLTIISDDIKAGNRLDGVCLALHGSMYVEGLDDPEGDLLERLRNLVGPDVPIVCALDMHANMTEKMQRAINGVTAYRTAPHIDKFETGARAAQMLLESLKDGTKLITEWIRLPIILSGEQSETDAEPTRTLMRALEEAGKQEGIFSASYLIGFAWADSPHTSVSVIVTGDRKRAQTVRATALHLAELFWERRHEFGFTTEAHELDDALSIALQDERRPIVIADSGDNPTAGASEELAIVLRTMLDRGIQDALVAVIADPDAMRIIEQAPRGEEISLKLGRIVPRPDGPKLEVAARVQNIDTVFNVRSAVLNIKGITTIVTENRIDVTDPQYLYQLGINPKNFKLIVVKSGYLSPAYQKLAARKIFALTPGDTSLELSQLPYRRVCRPIIPLDNDVAWTRDIVGSE